MLSRSLVVLVASLGACGEDLPVDEELVAIRPPGILTTHEAMGTVVPEFNESQSGEFETKEDAEVRVRTAPLGDGSFLLVVSDGDPWFLHEVVLMEVELTEGKWTVTNVSSFLSTDLNDGSVPWTQIQIAQFLMATDQPDGVLACSFKLYPTPISGTFICRPASTDKPVRPAMLAWYLKRNPR